jgi:hypothetical protein
MIALIGGGGQMTDIYTPYSSSLYETPLPTYRSFECMSYCRWKRVLSANLSEKGIISSNAVMSI